MHVEISPRAERDLENLADYIAQGSPRHARAFLQKLRNEIATIGEGPLRYQLRPDIGSDARLSSVGRYVILFRIAAPPGATALVRIERVLAGSRDLPGHLLP